MSPDTVPLPNPLHPELGETDLLLLFASTPLSFPGSNDSVDCYARHDDDEAPQPIPLTIPGNPILDGARMTAECCRNITNISSLSHQPQSLKMHSILGVFRDVMLFGSSSHSFQFSFKRRIFIPSREGFGNIINGLSRKDWYKKMNRNNQSQAYN